MGNIKFGKKLDSLTSIESFLNTVDPTKMKIGFLGGRTFIGIIDKKPVHFKMNDLINFVLDKGTELKWPDDVKRRITKLLFDINEGGETVLLAYKDEKSCAKRIQYTFTRWKQKALKTREFRKGKLVLEESTSKPSEPVKKPSAPKIPSAGSTVKLSAQDLLNSIKATANKVFKVGQKMDEFNTTAIIPKEYRNDPEALKKVEQYFIQEEKTHRQSGVPLPVKLTPNGDAFKLIQDDVLKCLGQEPVSGPKSETIDDLLKSIHTKANEVFKFGKSKAEFRAIDMIPHAHRRDQNALRKVERYFEQQKQDLSTSRKLPVSLTAKGVESIKKDIQNLVSQDTHLMSKTESVEFLLRSIHILANEIYKFGNPPTEFRPILLIPHKYRSDPSALRIVEQYFRSIPIKEQPEIITARQLDNMKKDIEEVINHYLKPVSIQTSKPKPPKPAPTLSGLSTKLGVKNLTYLETNEMEDKIDAAKKKEGGVKALVQQWLKGALTYELYPVDFESLLPNGVKLSELQGPSWLACAKYIGEIFYASKLQNTHFKLSDDDIIDLEKDIGLIINNKQS